MLDEDGVRHRREDLLIRNFVEHVTIQVEDNMMMMGFKDFIVLHFKNGECVKGVGEVTDDPDGALKMAMDYAFENNIPVIESILFIRCKKGYEDGTYAVQVAEDNEASPMSRD